MVRVQHMRQKMWNIPFVVKKITVKKTFEIVLNIRDWCNIYGSLKHENILYHC